MCMCMYQVEEMVERTAAGLPQVSKPDDKKAGLYPSLEHTLSIHKGDCQRHRLAPPVSCHSPEPHLMAVAEGNRENGCALEDEGLSVVPRRDI